MDEAKFWQLIQAAHEASGGDMEEKCGEIESALAALPAEEALAFARLFDTAMDRAYTWPLWGAAFIIHGGCSDDCFSDFRSALISCGQQAFENALANPDTLADSIFDGHEWDYEGYQYAVNDGVEEAAGEASDRESPHPEEPSGEEWSEEDVYERFPALTEKFG